MFLDVAAYFSHFFSFVNIWSIPLSFFSNTSPIVQELQWGEKKGFDAEEKWMGVFKCNYLCYVCLEMALQKSQQGESHQQNHPGYDWIGLW